ncbi:MAG TPA: 50S ribosomal protein L18 [Candidatus Acidoferrales bacterium]|nr:50S ribosomal protein L18 [Candidatus Acidoferrales bacterium]
MLSNQRAVGRLRRKRRVRKKVWGTDARPRLCVFRSLKHIYAQVISDERGITLAAASSLTPEIKAVKAKKTETARAVGALLARICKEKNITQVVFDRNGFLYHGRVKALAEAARQGGLSF